MNVYSILKTSSGWGLYRSGSQRAKLEAQAKEDIVRMSAEILIKETASVHLFG
ncbi:MULTISPECIES: hypothetical protein [unclassified Pseudomonas]|uniref:hypothetical protein n=1 Tax=unclassified Pseudomonas TaxID=196821 RepID=UPI00249E5852|nr:hypothetical protein [Pseudomonas sp. UYIF39]MDI3358606.1 hypothetical protein [Pseudomonas sp. UYIF39]